MSSTHRKFTERIRYCIGHPSALKIKLAVVLVIIGAAAYANGFAGPFIFDDEISVLENPYIVHLRPLSNVMLAPPLSTVAGRPIASLSLAVNYAVSGYSVWSYHFFNLLIHILAGLTLFGIVRRTLLCERLRDRFGKHSAVLAWIAAAIWVVHPIQTESVTYIVQRTESLMGLFYLLTLYLAIRAMQSQKPVFWSIISVVCCGLGMGTKEVMVTAPVLVLLYDRTFFAGSFIEAFRRRLGLYVSLAGMWVILAALLWSGPRQEQSNGFTIGTSLSYAANQGIVILRYLRLSVWPRGLCLDYSWPIAKDWGKLAPPMLVVLAMLTVTVWGIIRNKAWSYPAVWFFGVLSVTSSFVPVKDLIFEHRMYLPLAGLAVLAVAGGYVLFERRSARRAGIILAAAVIVLLGLATFRRNGDYRSAASIWQSVLDVIPDNPRAHNNLGSILLSQDRFDKAAWHYHQAIKIKPDFAEPYNNLGAVYIQAGRYNEALELCKQATGIKPDYLDAYRNLVNVYRQLGRYEDLIKACNEAIKLKPDYTEGYNNLGFAYSQLGLHDKAVEAYNSAVIAGPNDCNACYNLGLSYSMLNHWQEAIEAYRRSIILRPTADAWYNIAVAYASLSQWPQAIDSYKQTIAIKPAPDAYYNLGLAYLALGQKDLARKQCEILKRLDSELANKLSSLISANNTN